MKKAFLIAAGILCTGLGAVGTVVPLMPGTPFLMLAFVCFAKSSKKYHDWFVGTKLYKANLESFFKAGGMLLRVKVRIVLIVTAFMTYSFVVLLRKQILPGYVCVLVVWLIFLLYFIFGIKTLSKEEYEKLMSADE